MMTHSESRQNDRFRKQRLNRNQIEGLRGKKKTTLICWPRGQVPFSKNKQKNRLRDSGQQIGNEAVETSCKRHKQINTVKWLFGKPLKRERMIQLKYKQKQTNRFELNDVIVR